MPFIEKAKRTKGELRLHRERQAGNIAELIRDGKISSLLERVVMSNNERILETKGLFSKAEWGKTLQGAIVAIARYADKSSRK